MAEHNRETRAATKRLPRYSVQYVHNVPILRRYSMQGGYIKLKSNKKRLCITG